MNEKRQVQGSNAQVAAGGFDPEAAYGDLNGMLERNEMEREALQEEKRAAKLPQQQPKG